MIHHLILLDESPDIRLEKGRLISGSERIAIEVLGSVQCFASQARWTQPALEAVCSQCPVVMARWDRRKAKWQTFSLAPRCRYVNPTVLARMCRLSAGRSTQLASDLLYAKIKNQHQLLRIFDPWIDGLPRFRDNSFSRILRLEATYARTFWARYFRAASEDLFAREKRKAEHPLNAALNYGYAFLYHAIEWQCLANGLEPSVALIHRARRRRPSLACDLIEPFRCCVELTVIRYLDQIHEKKAMSGRFAEMLEERFAYRSGRFRLRSIIRLTVESFARAVEDPRNKFEPFLLHARDACV
jgi:CRISPR-associated endonuclease Cas1